MSTTLMLGAANVESRNDQSSFGDSGLSENRIRLAECFLQSFNLSKLLGPSHFSNILPSVPFIAREPIQMAGLHVS